MKNLFKSAIAKISKIKQTFQRIKYSISNEDDIEELQEIIDLLEDIETRKIKGD